MSQPSITVVIPTHNRAATLTRLLHCVQQQDQEDFECIVVDDGSTAETLAAYADIWKTLDDRFVLHARPRLAGRTSGPSATRNTGITLARAPIVAFCDDDDLWSRNDHRSVAVRAMTATGADLFLANMQTSIDGQVHNPDWYAALGRAAAKPPIAGETDVFALTTDDLGRLLRHRIISANTLVARVDLLKQIGMYWEQIRFAEDHDLAFRLADAAKVPLFRSTVTADADVSTHPSLARTFIEQERYLFSILAILHAEIALRNPSLRRIARGNRAWRFLELAQARQEAGEVRAAWELAVQSLAIHPSRAAFSLVISLSAKRLFA